MYVIVIPSAVGYLGWKYDVSWTLPFGGAGRRRRAGGSSGADSGRHRANGVCVGSAGVICSPTGKGLRRPDEGKTGGQYISFVAAGRQEAMTQSHEYIICCQVLSAKQGDFFVDPWSKCLDLALI